MEFRAVKVTDDVYWVGAIDWNVRDFHGYSTGRGTTYNAYLILADRITLIDTVKAQFKHEMMSRITSVVNPKEVDYLISNHAETDHSGALPYVVEEIKPERVFASAMGVRALNEHYHLKSEIIGLKDGEELDLGNMKLRFFETRMLHWPDSMMTYLLERKLLFSQDGFGMHLATGERFADQIDESLLKFEAAKYYANILLPYSDLVLKLIDRFSAMDIRPEIIAPDHGPIWRGANIEKIIGWYLEWARQQPRLKAVVVYDTMWQSTDLMARAIADGVAEAGLTVRVMRLRSTDRSDIITEVLDAGAVIVGSPTLNNRTFPTVADFLTYLKGLRPKNKIGAAFGSYGWSGEAADIIQAELKGMGMELPEAPLKVRYVPNQDALIQCYEFGRRLAATIKERTEGR